MHKFYLTNNLGGGGTNVSRFTTYQGIVKTTEIGLLLNYYYLNTEIKKPMSFDGSILKRKDEFSSIKEFLGYIRTHFINKGRITNALAIDTNSQPINSFLLDSGIGNLLRDLIESGNLSQDTVNALIEPYHAYGEDLSFDILIALDYALKYTYKGGERSNNSLTSAWEELARNQEKNLLLLKQTLHHLTQNNYKHQVFAPLHGVDFISFQRYGEEIKKLEIDTNKRFDGYALGGIAATRNLKDDVWGVPKYLNQNQKSAWLVSRLCKQTKNLIEDNPLHVLGAGSIYSLPFLTYSGATSSDCHTPWRRASDANSQILIPLLDDNLNFINDKNIYEYKKLINIQEGEYEFSLPLDITISRL